MCSYCTNVIHFVQKIMPCIDVVSSGGESRRKGDYNIRVSCTGFYWHYYGSIRRGTVHRQYCMISLAHTLDFWHTVYRRELWKSLLYYDNMLCPAQEAAPCHAGCGSKNVWFHSLLFRVCSIVVVRCVPFQPCTNTRI